MRHKDVTPFQRYDPEPHLDIDAIAIDSFGEDEKLFARVAIGWARNGGKMFEGRLLEAHVARVLDAEFPPVAISPWDLRIGGIHIQVRSASQGKSFKLRGDDEKIDEGINVWVLVEKPQEATTEARQHLRYFVLSRVEVKGIGHKSISHNRLVKGFASCGQADLLSRVCEAARR